MRSWLQRWSRPSASPEAQSEVLADATALLAAEDPAGALKQLDRLRRTPGMPVQALLLRGQASARLDRLEEAAKALDAATRRAPDQRDGWVELGQVQDRRGLHADAARCFERALQLDPDHAQTHRLLGLALRHLGTVEPAVTHLQRAVELDSGDPDLIYELAFTHYAAQQMDAAAKAFERFLMVAAVEHPRRGAAERVIEVLAQRQADPEGSAT